MYQLSQYHNIVIIIVSLDVFDPEVPSPNLSAGLNAVGMTQANFSN